MGEAQLREEIKASTSVRAQVVEQPNFAQAAPVQKPVERSAPQLASEPSGKAAPQLPVEENDDDDESSLFMPTRARGTEGGSSPAQAIGGSGAGGAGLGFGLADLA